MFTFIKKIFGTAQGRLVRKYRGVVRKINEMELSFRHLSDEELKGKTEEFKERVKRGESLDSLLVEAFAVVKNACSRLVGTEVHVSGYDQKWDMVPYDVQLIGAIAMHYGAIAEMQTGEGKTLTASLPLYLNALSGQPVHLVTANDYLAQRDCEWIGTIFRFLGLRVEALTNQTPSEKRREVYKGDIVYGTSSEFGFDYLRDHSMAQTAEEQSQRGHFFAIIDEVDSILIDEARTPLIISGPSSESYQMYSELQEPVAAIVRKQRDLCNKLASEAKEIIESLGLLSEEETEKKLTKQEEKRLAEGYRKLWLVSKGNPQNRLLKRIKEVPRLRTELDKLDIYFHAEPNKGERLAALAELYLIVDEKASEYELTDRGIDAWTNLQGVGEADFTMFDLGDEYAKIDAVSSLTEDEKMQRKMQIRQEDARRKERSHNLRQMLRGHLLMERDVDYIVDGDKVVIIDENTGRPQPGRRFSNGLHQAIEAKEGVKIQGETQTYATITLQNYFRMYKKLAGMTGTAMTEANEFKEIYKLDVVAIPTHRPCVRKDAHDEIYMTEREKYAAIVKDVVRIHGQGRPILIGTESVEGSEKLSRILHQNKIPHTVLNAKSHDKEAEIIAMAGKRGSITVATNMAGRGTDIKLEPGVADLGGLHVIGSTRNELRRIGRQMQGRCGRQGDPGTSQFYVSFEDNLMRLFTSPRTTLFLQKFRPEEGEPISARMLDKSIETAQKRIEQRNYTMRKHTLEYDDVMNKQREEIYAFRAEVLHTRNPIPLAEEIIEDVCAQVVADHCASRSIPGGWDVEKLRHWLMAHFPVTFEAAELEGDYTTIEEIEQLTYERVVKALQRKFAHEVQMIESFYGKQQLATEFAGASVLAEVVRSVLIRGIDKRWQEHLLHIDHLRTEVSLRSIGQKDPLLEFKHEAFALFDSLSKEMKVEIAQALFSFKMAAPEPIAPKETIIDLPRSKKEKPKLVEKPRNKSRPPMIDLSTFDLDHGF